MKSKSAIIAIAVLASELDGAGYFAAADQLDDELEELCYPGKFDSLCENQMTGSGEKIINDFDSDNDRFGNSEVFSKAASAFRKHSAVENSGVQDPENGVDILISTSARIAFRKTYPTWSKIRNDVLNEAIAESFAKGRIVQYFKPKKGDPNDVGEVRSYGSGRFIAIINTSGVRIIAVKGSIPALVAPPAAPAAPGMADLSKVLSPPA